MNKNIIKEYSYKVYIRRAEKLPDVSSWSSYLELQKSFTRIGGCEEKPSIKVLGSSNKLLSGGRFTTASEKVTFECADLEVTSDNYQSLRMLCREPVDIVFEDFQNRRVVVLKEFRITPELNISGEDFDKIKLKGEQTVIDADLIIYVSTFTEDNSSKDNGENKDIWTLEIKSSVSNNENREVWEPEIKSNISNNENRDNYSPVLKVSITST